MTESEDRAVRRENMLLKMNQEKKKNYYEKVPYFEPNYFGHQGPNEGLRVKRCRVAAYIYLALLFQDYGWKSCDEKDRDSKGKRRKLCLFFLSFVYLDNSDLRLSVAVCLTLSLFIVTFSLFHHWEIPWWCFSLLISFKLSVSCFTADDRRLSWTLSSPFICVLCFFSSFLSLINNKSLISYH